MDQQPSDFIPSPYSAPPGALPRAGVPGGGRRIAAAIAAIVVGVFFVLAVSAFAYFHTAPKLEAMVPPNVPLATSADLTWWWRAAAPLRRLPSVQKALAQWQEEGHFSVDSDILPWAGQGGFALLHYDAKKPQMAFFVQVRDWIAFAKFLRRMQARTPSHSSSKSHSTQSSYDGVPIVTEMEPSSDGGPPTLIQTAMLHGWYAVGVGAGSLQQVLDVYTGKKPSLASSAAWKTAQNHLPANAVGWSAIRMDSLIASMPRQASMKVSPDKLGYLTVTSFTAPDTGMRWDAVSVPTNPVAKHTLQQFAAAQTVNVTAAALASAPNDTVATFITSNATGRLDGLADLVSSMAASIEPDMVKNIKKQIAQLGNLNGLTEINLVVAANGTGGATAFADAASPQAAGQAESMLTSKYGAVPYSQAAAQPLPKLGPDFMDSLKLVSSVRGSRVQLATSGGLLAPSLPTGTPYLAFPAEATGASWVGAGNFRFLAALRNQMNDPKSAGANPYASQTDEFLNDAGLDNAQWVTWARTDPSGAWQQTTTTISNWQWRTALDRTVDSTIKLERQTGPGNPMPMPSGVSGSHPWGMKQT